MRSSPHKLSVLAKCWHLGIIYLFLSKLKKNQNYNKRAVCTPVYFLKWERKAWRWSYLKPDPGNCVELWVCSWECLPLSMILTCWEPLALKHNWQFAAIPSFALTTQQWFSTTGSTATTPCLPEASGNACLYISILHKFLNMDKQLLNPVACLVVYTIPS